MFSLTHTHPSHPTSFFRFAIFFSSTSSTLTDPFERRQFRLTSRPRLAAAFHPTSLTDSNQGSNTRYVKNHVVFSLFHAAVPVLFLSCAEDQEDLPGCGDDVVTPTHKASKPPFPVRPANQRTQTGSPWASRLSSGPLFPGTIAIQRSHSPIHDPSTPPAISTRAAPLLLPHSLPSYLFRTTATPSNTTTTLLFLFQQLTSASASSTNFRKYTGQAFLSD